MTRESILVGQTRTRNGIVETCTKLEYKTDIDTPDEVVATWEALGQNTLRTQCVRLNKNDIINADQLLRAILHACSFPEGTYDRVISTLNDVAGK